MKVLNSVLAAVADVVVVGGGVGGVAVVVVVGCSGWNKVMGMAELTGPWVNEVRGCEETGL